MQKQQGWYLQAPLVLQRGQVLGLLAGWCLPTVKHHVPVVSWLCGQK